MSKDYVLVTTLSHFKIKYAIPVEEFESLGFSEPVDTEALARYIQSGAVKEFTQQHLGEVVADVVEYPQEDLLTIFDSDNHYLSGWSQEQKIAWIDRWKEEPY